MNRPISDRLKGMIEDSRYAQVGVAAHRLSTGEEILIEPDRPFHPASTIKLCVMLETFHQVQQGLISLDDPVLITNEFHSIADGSLFSLDVDDDSEQDLYQRIGQSLPRRELVRRMITVSSNLATNLLVEQVRPPQINHFMRDLGLEDLVVLRGVEDKQAYRQGLNNSATARGLMKAFLKLARGEAVSPQASAEMVEILAAQQFHDMIPARLPADVRVAHKDGWVTDHYHDAGIVYPPNGEPFTLAILTKWDGEIAESEAHALVALLAEAIYSSWNPI